jgi:hypothetical protein
MRMNPTTNQYQTTIGQFVFIKAFMDFASVIGIAHSILGERAADGFVDLRFVWIGCFEVGGGLA